MRRKEYYLSREAEFDAEARDFEQQYRRLSYMRLVFTVLALILFLYFANARNGVAVALTLAVFPIGFGLMVRSHNRVKYRRDKARVLGALNSEELKRLELNLGDFDRGEGFADTSHEYSEDLDLFGKHSLFQLLNRTSTDMGKARLAGWMKSPSPAGEVLARQDAVKELAGTPEWIQEFEAEGRYSGDQQQSIDKLLEWLEGREEKEVPLNRLAAASLSVITLVMLILTYYELLTFGFLLFPLAVNIFFLGRIFVRLKDLSELTYEGAKALKAYYKLIEKVENTSFSSEKLLGIQREFKTDSFSAGEAVRSLDKLLDRLNSRINAFYAVINLVFLNDFHLIIALNQWKSKNGDSVRNWFSELADIEALVSIGGYAFANESYHFPRASSEPYQFQATTMGHPLIHHSKRVCNDVRFTGKGSVVIVTGSNMSGKSTFLRTVGINMVLGFLGAPVCAKECITSEFRLYTSMRTSDKLEESVSSFYAELQRLKGLIDLIDVEGAPVMYMIDEVLKGTNSADRHLGAKSLVVQLSKTPSMGWVSTHDLSLGDIKDESGLVQNMSFNSILQGDDLIFDYILTPDICKTFNASILMKKMGIDLLEAD